MDMQIREPFRSLLDQLAKGPNPVLAKMADRDVHPVWEGPFTTQPFVGLPGDRVFFHAIEQEYGIMTPGRDDRDTAEHDCDALNSAFLLGMAVPANRRTHITIAEAVEVLSRSERGRVVGRQLYDFLADRANSLDMDGKVAVLALLEESFINRPGSVFEALADAFAEHPHNLESPRSECAQ
jgi:hypothetical protein